MNFLRNYVLFVCLLLVFQLQAQVQNHTYITDRKFATAEELLGYTFVPGEMEFSDSDRRSLEAGELSIYITPQFMRIRGGGKEFEGEYNVVSIDATKFGFILRHMDARNPTEQGHLKFILDGNTNVDALIFKKNRDKPETILYQEPIPKGLEKTEAKYFTDKGEITVGSPDSIWGTKVLPFFRISPREQDRIEMGDSVSISFIEEIVIKTKEVEEEEVIEEEITDNEPMAEDEEDPFAEEDNEDDGDPLAGRVKKKVKKEKEEKEPKKEKEVALDEFGDEIEEDDNFDDDDEDAGFPDEMAEERLEEESGKAPKVKKEKPVKEAKIKEKREYNIVLRFNRWEGTGTEAVRKEGKLVYPVKSWRKKTSPDPNDTEERYLMEFSSKPNSILVFLDENSAITKIEIGSVVYWVRGH